MYAVRLARTITQRKTIAKIDGGWHGYTTDLLKTVNWPFRKSESSGLTDEKHIISLPYNDLENSIKILKSKKNDLAAVIIEPSSWWWWMHSCYKRIHVGYTGILP